MTGDALLSALRTFGPVGATIAQLRERLGVGSEDLDIGLKVLRDARLVIVENRRVMIPPDFTPRTRLDSSHITPYSEDHSHDESHDEHLRHDECNVGPTPRREILSLKRSAQADAA